MSLGQESQTSELFQESISFQSSETINDSLLTHKSSSFQVQVPVIVGPTGQTQVLIHEFELYHKLEQQEGSFHRHSSCHNLSSDHKKPQHLLADETSLLLMELPNILSSLIINLHSKL